MITRTSRRLLFLHTKLIRLGRQNVKSNILYTIIGNALILSVIGLMLVLLVIGQSMLSDLNDQFSMQVELQEDLSPADVIEIKSMIAAIDMVDASTIVFNDRSTCLIA